MPKTPLRSCLYVALLVTVTAIVLLRVPAPPVAQASGQILVTSPSSTEEASVSCNVVTRSRMKRKASRKKATRAKVSKWRRTAAKKSTGEAPAALTDQPSCSGFVVPPPGEPPISGDRVEVVLSQFDGDGNETKLQTLRTRTNGNGFWAVQGDALPDGTDVTDPAGVLAQIRFLSPGNFETGTLISFTCRILSFEAEPS